MNAADAIGLFLGGLITGAVAVIGISALAIHFYKTEVRHD